MLANAALVAVHARGIGEDQPRVERLDRVLHIRHVLLDISAIGKGVDEFVAVVTVARDDEIRGGESVEDSARRRIFLSEAVMGYIASMDDHVGLGIEGVDAIDAHFEIGDTGRIVT